MIDERAGHARIARNRREGVGRILGALAFAILAVVSTPSQQLPLSAWLDTALRQSRPDDRHIIWVYFKDKGSATTGRAGASSALSARALTRRAVRARLPAEAAVEDLALERTYVEWSRDMWHGCDTSLDGSTRSAPKPPPHRFAPLQGFPSYRTSIW